jgi:hypothetical protein
MTPLTTRRTLRRSLAAAAVAPLLLVGVAACGSDESTSADDVSASTSSTSSTTSSSASADDSAGESIDPATFVDDVLGGLTDATTAHLTMSMTGGPAEMTMEGDVDYSATPPEMAVKMSMATLGSGDIEMRLVDGVMYMQMPQLGNGKWIEMDLNGAGSPIGDDLLKQMNPKTQLDTMKDAATKVEYVGEDSVGKHYTLTVRSQAFRDLESQLGSAGAGAADKLPSVLTYDLWTDDDGLLTQTKIALGDLGSMTMTLTGWGEPVDISAPPASDIMKLPAGMMPGTASS